MGGKQAKFETLPILEWNLSRTDKDINNFINKNNSFELKSKDLIGINKPLSILAQSPLQKRDTLRILLGTNVNCQAQHIKPLIRFYSSLRLVQLNFIPELGKDTWLFFRVFSNLKSLEKLDIVLKSQSFLSFAVKDRNRKVVLMLHSLLSHLDLVLREEHSFEYCPVSMDEILSCQTYFIYKSSLNCHQGIYFEEGFEGATVDDDLSDIEIARLKLYLNHLLKHQDTLDKSIFDKCVTDLLKKVAHSPTKSFLENAFKL